MNKSETQWVPRVGERVSIKGTVFSGIVQRINGQGEDRRYIVPEAVANRSVFWLEEIEAAHQRCTVGRTLVSMIGGRE